MTACFYSETAINAKWLEEVRVERVIFCSDWVAALQALVGGCGKAKSNLVGYINCSVGSCTCFERNDLVDKAAKEVTGEERADIKATLNKMEWEMEGRSLVAAWQRMSVAESKVHHLLW